VVAVSSLPRVVLGAEPFHAAFRRAAWEDAELGYRLSVRGLRIVYCQAARTRHHHPMTMTGFLRRQQVVGEEAEVMYTLHPELADSDVMPPFSPPRWLRLVNPLMPFLVPVLARLDRLGVRLPQWCYRGVVLAAYFRGRRRARGGRG